MTARLEAAALPSAVPVLLLIPRTARVRPAHVKDDSKATHFLKDLVSRSDIREISQRLARVGLPEYQPDRGWRRRHQEDDDTFWDSTCRRRARGQIVGVALVALPGQRHTSSLSMLSREHRMLSKFFFRREQCQVWRIFASWMLWRLATLQVAQASTRTRVF